MRMAGPIIGFGFAYLTMRIYIDPTKTPIISKDDPRWLGIGLESIANQLRIKCNVKRHFSSPLGAWWLGWIILGFLMFIFAGLIGLFPKHLPKKRKMIVKNEFDREKCEQIVEIADKHDDKDVNLKSKLFNKNNISRAMIRSHSKFIIK